MGTNKRYPSRVADDIAARVPQAVSRPRPVSLSDAKLDKENTRVTTAPEPIPVRAWVRYPEAPGVCGEAVEFLVEKADPIESEPPRGDARIDLLPHDLRRERPSDMPNLVAR
ncbi:hypothetical protein ELQ90_01025 [Labedella phragmitis]|uniref:Uncharacterized protein n=1 Tax=Labedella phragmitis TaxID=2498849 RepID=A0A3S4ANP4_9MICO|nr:hypothetical protein [Labedella phragmitis]RWZ52571.1 hypothetical protein ELQ90_01025 [Labedella phragmitis]